MSDVLETNSFFKWDIFFSKSSLHDLNKDRLQKGEFYTLYSRLRNYEDKFFEYTRMSISTFDYILENIREEMLTTSTNFVPVTITPEQKLLLTLR